MFNRIQQRLTHQKQKHRYRQRLCLEQAQAAFTRVAQQNLYNFSSNDYLGFANHPRLIQALQYGAQRWGVGSGAAHLVSGHSQIHEELERAIASFTQRPRALLFSTGYMANMATISSLVNKKDTVLHDRLNHASLIDGTRLAGSKFMRYQHADMHNLELRLQRAQGQKMVVSDGVFSMDGDIAPLSQLVQLCSHYQAFLMVDDAHGFGVLGAQGAGVLEETGLTVQQVPVLMGTLGKALGTSGAFIAGSEELIEYLIQFARPYIYTTAISPALAYASLIALELLDKEAWRRHHLQQLISYFQTQAIQFGLEVLPSRTPIQPILIKDNMSTMQLAYSLRQRGFLVGAIRPPTVPEHSARLRITLSADHQPKHIDALLNTLHELKKSP